MNRYRVKLVFEENLQRLTYEKTVCAETYVGAIDATRMEVEDWYMASGTWPLTVVEVERLS